MIMTSLLLCIISACISFQMLQNMLDESYHYRSLLSDIEKAETDFICRQRRQLDCDHTNTYGNSSFREPEVDMYCDLMDYLKIANSRLRNFQISLQYKVRYFRILNVHLI